MNITAFSFLKTKKNDQNIYKYEFERINEESERNKMRYILTVFTLIDM